MKRTYTLVSLTDICTTADMSRHNTSKMVTTSNKLVEIKAKTSAKMAGGGDK